MVSDTLSDAVHFIREYLDSDLGDQCYGVRGTPLREWIEATVVGMNALREHIDQAPPRAAKGGDA